MTEPNPPPDESQRLHRLILQESLAKSPASQVQELRSLMFGSSHAQHGMGRPRLSSLTLKPEQPPLTLVEAIRQMSPGDLAKLFATPMELPETPMAKKAVPAVADTFWPASREPINAYGVNKEEASELIRRGMFDPAPTRSTRSLQGFTGLMMVGTGIDLADAIVKKDSSKATAVVSSVVGGEAYMAFALGTAGAAALPAALAIGGAVGGGFDTYSAIRNHDTQRAVKSGIETTLYSIAAWAGAATAADVWFPPLGVATGTVALVAGGLAASMTLSRTICDHWGTVKSWFSKRGNDVAGLAAPVLPAPTGTAPLQAVRL